MNRKRVTTVSFVAVTVTLAVLNRWRYFAGVTLAAVFLNACTTDDEPPPATLESSSSLTFDVVLDSNIQSARHSGSSEEQLRLLEEARALGLVSVQTLFEALTYYEECIIGLGGRVEIVDTSGPVDFPWIDYYTSVGEGEEHLMDECLDLHLRFINYAYQEQPAYRAARAERMLDYREPLVDCLRSHGRDIEDGATPDELRREIMYGITGFYPEDAASGVIDPGFFDCASEVGLAPTDLSI